MASDGWYGPAINDIARSDGGSHAGPVTIGCLHTTESPRAYRMGTSTNYGNFGHGSFPHFTVDVVSGVFKVWQHISIRRAARALKNLRGGVETNREGVIQIEVNGSATRPFTDNAVMVAGLAALMRWIESETEIPPTSGVEFLAYPASYGNRRKQRLSFAQWRAFKGWLGHMHVPENDHGDPGAIDIDLLLDAPGASIAHILEDSGMRMIRNDEEGNRRFGACALLAGPRAPFEHVENPEIAGSLGAALGGIKQVNAREFDLVEQYLLAGEV